MGSTFSKTDHRNIKTKQKENKMNSKPKSGFKDQKNVYMCNHCGHGFVTQDMHEGTTPMMTKCLNCKGTATSMFYKIPQQLLGKPALFWVRPPEAGWGEYSPGVQEHLKNGGLIRSDTKPKTKKKPLFKK